MWIKICGITSLEDAEMAIAAGADAIGFVFAESPRRVTPKAARAIVERLPASVEKIGVFVDARLEEIAETYQVAGLTGMQLHGLGCVVALPDLRARIGETSRVLQVVRYDMDAAHFALKLPKFHKKSANDHQPDAILIDTSIAGKHGGTGIAFDWQAARASFIREASHLRLIAAGGLRPENVREAIQTLEPWGIDVSSGVEASPGRKDSQRVASFIRSAQEAWAELQETGARMKL